MTHGAGKASDNNQRLWGVAADMFKSAVGLRFNRFRDAGLASLIINLVSLVTSLFAMQVYDRVVPNNAHDTLWVLFSGVMIAIVIEGVLKQIRASVLDLTGKSIELELSQTFFNKALAIRMDARPNTVGTFAAQIREFESVKSFLTSTTLYAIADAPFALFFLCVIFLIGGWIGLVPLAALPITVLLGWWVQKPLGELSRKHMLESNIKNGMLIETIDGAESVKATGGEGWFSQRWYRLSVTTSEVGIQIRRLSNLSGTLSTGVQQLAYACMIVAGAYAISKGALTMGGLIACSILSGRVLSPITQLAGMAVSWHHAKQALLGLNDLMGRPSTGPAPDEKPLKLEQFQPSFRFDQTVFRYGPEKVGGIAVHGLDIEAGTRMAIVGPTGSGKTSLLKLMTGLYKPSEGRVFASGVDLQLLDPAVVRSHIAYLPQDVRLFNGTLRDNLCLGIKPPSDDALLKVCELTGLAALITSHPRGLGIPISEGGRGLSGGQKQMVGLARVLLQNPAVLLLDEPTASLDPTSENELIRRLMGFVRPEQTLVIVTHKPALLALVNRLTVIDKGRVVLDGPRDEVLQKLSGNG